MPRGGSGRLGDLIDIGLEGTYLEDDDLFGAHHIDLGPVSFETEANGGFPVFDMHEEAAMFNGGLGFDLGGILRRRSDECCINCCNERGKSERD